MATRTTHKIQCSEHGGFFVRPAQRGRVPSKCKPEYPCDRVGGQRNSAPMPRKVTVRGSMADIAKSGGITIPSNAGIPDFDAMSNAELKSYARENFSTISKLRSRSQLIAAMRAQLSKPVLQAPTQTATQPVEDSPKPRSTVGASLAKAQAAKEALEAQGWAVVGKAWKQTTLGNGFDRYASVTATRGEELIAILWQNGELISQDYTMWNTEHPIRNGKPFSRLPFDPDEVGDAELTRTLAGMKVKFFNRLGKSEETVIISRDKIEINHIYNGKGDEVPGERVVRFVAADGSGFRAFRLDQLLEIG